MYGYTIDSGFVSGIKFLVKKYSYKISLNVFTKLWGKLLNTKNNAGTAFGRL